jgi:hypothetical protein
MTRAQLEQQREGVEAQLCWAVLHRGDQELLDLLRIESSRLCVMIRAMSLPDVERGVEPVKLQTSRPCPSLEHDDDGALLSNA